MSVELSAEDRSLVAGGLVTSDRRVYVVDDNRDVRRSLHFSLAAVGISAWPFVCAQDFLDQADTLTPSPILLDVRMPEIDGLQMLAALRDRNIGWPVIMMSAHGDIPIAVQSIQLGAVDFLEKPFGIGELELLLSNAYVHLSEVTCRAEVRVRARAAWERLSAREAQVIELLLTGVSNKVVAQELGLSPRTVEIHRASGLAKLELKSLAQVALLHLHVSGVDQKMS